MEEKPRSVEEGGGCFYSYRSEDGPRRDCGYQADSCTLTRGANKGKYIRGLRLQFARLQHNQTETTISALQLDKLIMILSSIVECTGLVIGVTSLFKLRLNIKIFLPCNINQSVLSRLLAIY